MACAGRSKAAGRLHPKPQPSARGAGQPGFSAGPQAGSNADVDSSITIFVATSLGPPKDDMTRFLTRHARISPVQKATPSTTSPGFLAFAEADFLLPL